MRCLQNLKQPMRHRDFLFRVHVNVYNVCPPDTSNPANWKWSDAHTTGTLLHLYMCNTHTNTLFLGRRVAGAAWRGDVFALISVRVSVCAYIRVTNLVAWHTADIVVLVVECHFKRKHTHTAYINCVTVYFSRGRFFTCVNHEPWKNHACMHADKVDSTHTRVSKLG